jgi:preprotein translocase subunit YajC
LQGLDSSIVFLILVGVVFYLMLYRPNKKRIDQHRRLIESASEGDEIVTIGGVFGTIREITDEQFHVEISPGTTIRIAKSAIGRLVEPQEDAAAAEIEPSQDADA